MPHLNELHAQYKDDGLVLIGVHTAKGSSAAAAFVKAKGVAYPVCVDSSGATVRAFSANSFPDYYVIDRAGVLRYADLSNRHVDAVVAKLLAEPGPGNAHISRLRQVVTRQPLLALGGIEGDKPGAVLDMVMRSTFGDDKQGPWLEVETVRVDRSGSEPLLRTVVRMRANESLTLLRMRSFVGGKLVTDLAHGAGKLKGRLEGETVLRNVPKGLGHEAGILFLASLFVQSKDLRQETLALMNTGHLSRENAHILRVKQDPQRPGVRQVAWMLGNRGAQTLFDFGPKGELLGLRERPSSRRASPKLFQVLKGDAAASLIKRLLPQER